MASTTCPPEGSFTEIWNLKISCSEAKIHWKLPSVTLDLLPMPIRKNTSLSDVGLLASLPLKSSTSRTCLSRAKPSAMSSLLESFSITCSSINLSFKAQVTAIFLLKIELVNSTSTRKNIKSLTVMLWIFLRECLRKDQSLESLPNKPWNINLYPKTMFKRWKSKKSKNLTHKICSRRGKLRQLKLPQLSRAIAFRKVFERKTQALLWAKAQQNSTVFTQKVVTSKMGQGWFQWKRRHQTCPVILDQRVKQSKTRWLMKSNNINDLLFRVYCFNVSK